MSLSRIEKRVFEIKLSIAFWIRINSVYRLIALNDLFAHRYSMFLNCIGVNSYTV